MERLFYKDPDAVLDYSMDWSTWLASGEIISTYAVSADSSLITISTHSYSSNTVTAWLSGGNVGQSYDVKVKVVTSGSRTDERSFRLKIKER